MLRLPAARKIAGSRSLSPIRAPQHCPDRRHSRRVALQG
jgi:hypothetical protein